MSKMLVALTLLWAHGAVAARPSADRLLDRLSTEPGPQQEWTSWGHSKNPLLSKLPKDLLTVLGLTPSDMRDKIEQALKDLGIKATQKQTDELHERLSSAGIGQGSDASHEEYVKLVKMFMPLDVTASAVAFCSDLVKGVTEGKKTDAQLEPSFGFGKSHFAYTKPNSGQLGRKMFEQENRRLGRFHPQQLTALAAKDIQKEADKFKGLCPEILTGSLDKGESVPKWALEAASWSQPRGEHHKLGRLDKVKAVKGSHWKVTFERVCKDECEALVNRIQEKAWELDQDFKGSQTQKPKTVEQSCADHIVKHVESEILGCCSRSCGWNGQNCAFWPFLSSTEKADWQAECCTELNVLDGSTRELMCNSTLADEEKNEVIRDGRPNTPNDRKILGMDLYGNSALQTHSFLQNQKNRAFDDSCQPPLDLHNKHGEWKKNWKRMPRNAVVTDKEECEKKDKDKVTGCTAFVTEKANGPYTCWSGCQIEKPVNPLENLDDTARGSMGYLYIHKSIFAAWS